MPKSERQRLHLIKLAELKKGKPMTEETKRRIGLGNKGKVHSEEHIEKFRKSMIGKNTAPKNKEWKDKISKAHKGKPKIERRGQNHWNWKGGIKTENQIVRSSIEYKKWREEVFKRDCYSCVKCGLKGGWSKVHKRTIKLNADHIKPFSVYIELRFELANGRTLCRECHQKTHSWGINSKYIKKDEN